MQISLLNFICSGTAGELMLGLSRSDVIAKLGEPENWLGKPHCFGPIILDPGKAAVWFYYGDAVGVEFDNGNIAVRMVLLPKMIRRQAAPFEHWPIDASLTMAGFRDYLLQHRVPFYEELDPEYVHYFLAQRRCVAQCSYYKKGSLIPPDDRPITMIATVANDDLLPNFVRGKHQREWSVLRACFGAQFEDDSGREHASLESISSAYVRQGTPESLRTLNQAIRGFLSRFDNDDELERKLYSELGYRYELSSKKRSTRNLLESIASRLGGRNVQ